MNIFHLDKDPRICARYHCDKHVVKMILETAQMLSTAYQKHCGDDYNLYKPAYPKHPMTIWVGDSLENFRYALALGEWLAIQYTYRYKKVHKSQKIIDHIRFHKLKNVVKNFTKVEFTRPPLCMPDEYKCDDYVQAYRNYYIGDKKEFARYTSVDVPKFMC